MRYFSIYWYAKDKYNSEQKRFTRVTTGGDAQTALKVFMKEMGNLKKNEIIHIQETLENGTPVGEPVMPDSIEKSVKSKSEEDNK